MFKKKKSPIFAVAIGALAVFGAYSMVSSVKGCLCKKAEKLMNMFKSRDEACCCECEQDED